MKGPSLRYDLRVLRVFQCDACGRQIQTPASTTSRTCGCSDPPKFMRPLERVRITPPDVTRFLSPPDPADLIEEEETVEEPYVPFIPQMPPKPVPFPRRRKLSDEIDQFQPPDFGVGVDDSTEPGESTDGDQQKDQDQNSEGPQQRTSRSQRNGRDGSRPAFEKRDRNRPRDSQRPERPKRERRDDVMPPESGPRSADSRSANDPISADVKDQGIETGGDAGPVRRPRRRRGRNGQSPQAAPARDVSPDEFGSGLESPDRGLNLSGTGGESGPPDPDDERSGGSSGSAETGPGDAGSGSRQGRRRGRRRSRGREPGRGPGNASDAGQQGGS